MLHCYTVRELLSLYPLGSIAPALSVLSNTITATCHRHGDSETTVYSVDQLEQLDLNSPSLYKWQVEVCGRGIVLCANSDSVISVGRCHYFYPLCICNGTVP